MDRRPFASFTLGAAHNDPAVLLASLIEALEPIEPLPDDVVTTIQAPEPNLDVIVPLLEAALRAGTGEAVLVIDELEHLHTDSSLRLLEAIVNGVGGPLSLAMATRRKPQIHVARLQAARRLTVLGSEDLVMTSGEARALLAEAGLDAPDDGRDAPFPTAASAARSGTWSTTCARSCSPPRPRRTSISWSGSRCSTVSAAASATP